MRPRRRPASFVRKDITPEYRENYDAIDWSEEVDLIDCYNCVHLGIREKCENCHLREDKNDRDMR